MNNERQIVDQIENRFPCIDNNNEKATIYRDGFLKFPLFKAIKIGQEMASAIEEAVDNNRDFLWI